MMKNAINKKYFTLILVIVLLGTWVSCTREVIDLSGSIECPAQAYPGKELRDSIKVVLKNSGTVAAKDFSVDLVLSSDTVIPVEFATYSPNFSEDVLLKGGREHVDSLAADGSLDLLLNGSNKIPDDTPPGNYYLGLVVDSGEKVEELSEDNNTGLCLIEIKECDPVAEITSFQVIEASGGTVGFAQMKLGWEYGAGEKPTRLLVTVYRLSAGEWDNIMPEEEPFEVPSPSTTTVADVTIFRLFSGDYKFVFNAFYSCERENEYTFDWHL